MKPMLWLFAGISAFGLLAADATRGQTQPKTQDFAPIAPPTFDPALLQTPQAGPAPNAATFKPDKSDKTAPAPALPKSLDFGKYQLEFDAKNSRDAAKSGVTMDSGETSNLSKVTPGQKPVPVIPNYFGLKLSTPTH